METVDTDVLVVGGGVAGIMAAYRAAAAGARVVLLLGSPGASNRISSMNSALYQRPEDNPADLLRDMRTAGGGVANDAVLRRISEQIGAETRHLAALGVPFQRQDESYARRTAAGSSWSRSVFSLGMVGVDIQRVVLGEILAIPSVTVLRDTWLVDLDSDDGAVCGGTVYLRRDSGWAYVRAAAVVLATGGIGRLYETSTNPPGSHGIGLSLALENGVDLVDMEFISFEPFIACAPDNVKGRDLPTTVLAQGARLRNALGEEFLATDPPPSKDVICRAIAREVAAGRGTASGGVLFDLREMDPEIARQYLQIRQTLTPLGIDSTEAQIEVWPAQHYCMGGIPIDEDGRTSLPGLYAVGEVSAGAHGAHRLAGAGGTEAVAMGSVGGAQAAKFAIDNPVRWRRNAVRPRPELLPPRKPAEASNVLRRTRRAMDQMCGVARTASDLERTVALLHDELRALDARDKLATYPGRVAVLQLAIAASALARAESRGDHFRLDFPSPDTAWIGNMVARPGPESVKIEFRSRAASTSLGTKQGNERTIGGN